MEQEKNSNEDLIENIERWAENYAKENKWILNTDEKQKKIVLKGLAKAKRQWGKQFCPCRIWNPHKDTHVICPCIYHREEIENDGYCHCHFFFKKEVDQ